MKVAIIENNVVSLLTFVFDYYYKFNKSIDKVQISCDKNLIDEYIKIGEDKEKAIRVRNSLTQKVGNFNYVNITKAFLSNNENKCQILFEYILMIFKYGRKTIEMYNIDTVIKFNDMLKKVKHEAHRMNGFIRFKLLENGTYYGFFSGDNDVLELIIPHFKDRYNDQRFVLHDVKRFKLAYYDGLDVIITPTPKKINIKLHEEEILFDKLWKQYFVNVNIDERKNLKQQQSYLPKKYRWFMNEF